MTATAAAHPDARVALWFMDGWTRHASNRVGQQGRLCYRWWAKGRRPPGRRDKRFESADLFAAVEPATGAEVALVLPEATTRTMNLFLAAFAAGLPADVHAVLVLDRAGWHRAKALAVPANVTLVPLPPYSPELNPVERVWLYLRERYLSLRVFKDYRAIVDACCAACCAAWNRLVAEPDRLRSLTRSALDQKRHFIGSAVQRLTRWAEADLAEIGGFIAERNPRAALRIIAELEDRCCLLGEHPELGPAREDIAPGLRYLAVGRYLILYRIVDHGIEVVRVVHGARHLPPLLP